MKQEEMDLATLVGKIIVAAEKHEHDEWSDCLALLLDDERIIHVVGVGYDWGSVEVFEDSHLGNEMFPPRRAV